MPRHADAPLDPPDQAEALQPAQPRGDCVAGDVYEPLQGDYNVQLTNRLSANTAGDVFYLPGETVQPFVATGRILPLNGLIDSRPFLTSLNRTFTVNNRLYAIAKDFNTLALVYNRDLFEEARVPVTIRTRTSACATAATTSIVSRSLG